MRSYTAASGRRFEPFIDGYVLCVSMETCFTNSQVLDCIAAAVTLPPSLLSHVLRTAFIGRLSAHAVNNEKL